MFSKKARNIDEIITVDLTYLHDVKLAVKISSTFVAFLENINFKTVCMLIFGMYKLQQHINEPLFIA